MRKVYETTGKTEWLKSNAFDIVAYTQEYKTSDGELDSDSKKVVVKSGKIYPANDGTAKGIVRSDYDVTYGSAIGSLVVHADVVENKLPETVTAEAKTALEKVGIHFF